MLNVVDEGSFQAENLKIACWALIDMGIGVEAALVDDVHPTCHIVAAQLQDHGRVGFFEVVELVVDHATHLGPRK